MQKLHLVIHFEDLTPLSGEKMVAEDEEWFEVTMEDDLIFMTTATLRKLIATIPHVKNFEMVDPNNPSPSTTRAN